MPHIPLISFTVEPASMLWNSYHYFKSLMYWVMISRVSEGSCLALRTPLLFVKYLLPLGHQHCALLELFPKVSSKDRVGKWPDMVKTAFLCYPYLPHISPVVLTAVSCRAAQVTADPRALLFWRPLSTTWPVIQSKAAFQGIFVDPSWTQLPQALLLSLLWKYLGGWI